MEGGLTRGKVPAAIMGTEFTVPLSGGYLQGLTRSRPLLIAVRRGITDKKFKRRITTFLRRRTLRAGILEVTVPSYFIRRKDINRLGGTLKLSTSSIARGVLTRLPRRL